MLRRQYRHGSPFFNVVAPIPQPNELKGDVRMGEREKILEGVILHAARKEITAR